MGSDQTTDDTNEILTEIARQIGRLHARPSYLQPLDPQQALKSTHLAQDLFNFATMSTSPIGGGGHTGAGSPMGTSGGHAITPTTTMVNCPHCRYRLTVKLS